MLKKFPWPKIQFMPAKLLLGLCVLLLGSVFPSCHIMDFLKGPAPHFVNMSIEANTLSLWFSKDIKNINKDKILLERTPRGGPKTALEGVSGKDYSLAIKGRKLEITLLREIVDADTYQITLLAGLAMGKNDKMNPPPRIQPPAITFDGPPVLNYATLYRNRIVLAFTTRISRKNDSLIILEKKQAGGDFTLSPNPIIQIDTENEKRVEISPENPAEGDVYRVKLLPGAIFNPGEFFKKEIPNNKEAQSLEVKFTKTPALEEIPYILGRTLIAVFSKNIVLKDYSKITVRKKAAAGSVFQDIAGLLEGHFAVDTVDKKRLEITLNPAPEENEQYRVSFAAGAVNEEGKTDNENDDIPALQDITVQAGPALVAENPYYIAGENTNVLTIVLDKSHLEILDKSKIQYEKNGEGFNAVPISVAITGANSDRLEVTIPNTSNDDEYKIKLLAGAVRVDVAKDEAKNLAENADIEPPGKISTNNAAGNIDNLSALSTRRLLADFANSVLLLDEARIRVQKKAEGDVVFSDVAGRSISTSADGNVLITLDTAAADKDTYRVIFPAGTVLDTAERSGNRLELTSSELLMEYASLLEWKQVKANIPGTNPVGVWFGRGGHDAVVFQNKIWIMGGGRSGADYNDVWSSPDGNTWIRVDPADKNRNGTIDDDEMWEQRSYHRAAVFNDEIWVTGGKRFKNGAIFGDVWTSTDGKNWRKLPTPPWRARYYHNALVDDGKIWLMGGVIAGNKKLQDVWNTADGQTWSKLEPDSADKKFSIIPRAIRVEAPWGEYRARHASVIFQGKLWILGGLARLEPIIYLNDVWTLGPPATSPHGRE